MIVHSHYPVGETRVQRQAAALVRSGWDVDVIALRGETEPDREIVEGVRVIRLPVRRHRGSGMPAQLLEYAAFFVLAFAAFTGKHLRRRYHSVQVHNLPDFLVFVAIAAKLSRTPVILDLHDLMPEFLASRLDAGLGHPLVRLALLQERLACGFADHVVTVSAGWRDVLARRSARSDKVGVVMNLPDESIFKPGGGDRSGRQSADFTLVYHGTFTRRYGVDLIVEAVDRLASDLPGLRAHLLGDGELRPELASMIDQRGLGGRVTMSDGFVGTDLLPAQLADADVAVVPNRSDVFTDGIVPTKLLECAAMGLPAVVARTPGVVDYFDDDMVEYFEPGDVDDLVRALIRLWESPTRRSTIAVAARRFADTHSWSRAAADYVGLMDRLAARP